MIPIANVDIQRLQILEDSINRTMAALNQVRLSVHGPVTPDAFGVSPAVGGLAHAAAQNAFAYGALANQLTNPFVNAALANAATNPFTNPFANPYAANPYAAIAAATGLGHTAFGATYADPYNTARIAQTFPFISRGYSPFASSTF
jgi:hypothetical protein